ncbi:MAG: hypothetical protein L6311_16030 [Cellulomonas sp.]|nr:hypothetical protein [Cellulomonas sp.]
MNERASDGGEDVDDEAVVRGTFATLDQWRRIEGPFIPISSSELARDDTDWPHYGVSQVAWVGFTVAVEHLQAIRAHIDVRPPNRPNLFGSAHQTLARTALIGAATAVWVLAPDDRGKRLERARSVAAYQHDEHHKYLRALQGLAAHAGTDAVADHVAMRQRELARKRAVDGDTARYETTKIVREAALAAFKTQLLADEVVAGWRSGSGAAHGLVYPLLGGPRVAHEPAGGDGLSTFTVGGAFELFSNAYMAAFHLANHGWSLLVRRGR